MSSQNLFLLHNSKYNICMFFSLITGRLPIQLYLQCLSMCISIFCNLSLKYHHISINNYMKFSLTQVRLYCLKYPFHFKQSINIVFPNFFIYKLLKCRLCCKIVDIITYIYALIHQVLTISFQVMNTLLDIGNTVMSQKDNIRSISNVKYKNNYKLLRYILPLSSKHSRNSKITHIDNCLLLRW